MTTQNRQKSNAKKKKRKAFIPGVHMKVIVEDICVEPKQTSPFLYCICVRLVLSTKYGLFSYFPRFSVCILPDSVKHASNEKLKPVVAINGIYQFTFS